MFNLKRFVDKYQLALETALQNKPQGGLFGFELEWNLLNQEFYPKSTIKCGQEQESFVDYIRDHCLSSWLREFSQLEVFNWMIEWATRPYYHANEAVYEARLMEGVLINALSQARHQIHENLYYWHGNLPVMTTIGYDSIPGSWHIAKRRYLERCVDMYGESLATAGTHTNLSLPDPLFAWDFMHLSPSERGDMHLDDFKSQFYITATRLLRAFAALFIATSASTPFLAAQVAGQAVVLLTAADSVRNLTFPNPQLLDVPSLYRSYEDYLRLSYDLVRRGIRFGNNNWTPVRARSFAEPVERLIAVTSDQLQDIYARGLYPLETNATSTVVTLDEIARQIEVQNLLARINLPMARVEVRTDDGGHSLEVDIANVTLKHLLMLRFYADPVFARAFRYDAEDINRARRNEEQAAFYGLRAMIENPFTGKPIAMRQFLRWTLGEIRPLAEALDCWRDLSSLEEMADGAENTAGLIRQRVINSLDDKKPISLEVIQNETAERASPRLAGGIIVPIEILRQLVEERIRQVQGEVEHIVQQESHLHETKLAEFIQQARAVVRIDPHAPIHYRQRMKAPLDLSYPDKTSEIVALAQQLIRIPSVTACPEERLPEIHQAATFIFDYLNSQGVEVHLFNQHKYPALFAHFPGQEQAPVMLCGHFDVVAPEPDDTQFEPRIEGDYLWGRGAADMKTVVATYLVWMKDIIRQGAPFPGINLLLVGNEENGEIEPTGTPHVLKWLEDMHGYKPQLLIAGERTGEKGDEAWGEVCTQNRGVIRGEIVLRGGRGHTGIAGASSDLTEQLIQAHKAIQAIFNRSLTLHSSDGWQSQARFPYTQVGTPGIYNISADHGVLGLEVRPIPQDNINQLRTEIQDFCNQHGLELSLAVFDPGIACNPQNPYLHVLLQAIHQASGEEPKIGRKLPGTSARFAPGGMGLVWGQTGLAPHARDERHFIPSILPYYQALQAFKELLVRPSRND